MHVLIEHVWNVGEELLDGDDQHDGENDDNDDEVADSCSDADYNDDYNEVADSCSDTGADHNKFVLGSLVSDCKRGSHVRPYRCLCRR
jgi:hypothetical protein